MGNWAMYWPSRSLKCWGQTQAWTQLQHLLKEETDNVVKSGKGGREKPGREEMREKQHGRGRVEREGSRRWRETNISHHVWCCACSIGMVERLANTDSNRNTEVYCLSFPFFLFFSVPFPFFLFIFNIYLFFFLKYFFYADNFLGLEDRKRGVMFGGFPCGWCYSGLHLIYTSCCCVGTHQVALSFYCFQGWSVGIICRFNFVSVVVVSILECKLDVVMPQASVHLLYLCTHGVLTLRRKG